jgi:hypothetical protein
MKWREPALRQAVITTGTRRANIAPTRCATSTRGTSAFDVKPGRSCTSGPDQRVRVW